MRLPLSDSNAVKTEPGNIIEGGLIESKLARYGIDASKVDELKRDKKEGVRKLLDKTRDELLRDAGLIEALENQLFYLQDLRK